MKIPLLQNHLPDYEETNRIGFAVTGRENL